MGKMRILPGPVPSGNPSGKRQATHVDVEVLMAMACDYTCIWSLIAGSMRACVVRACAVGHGIIACATCVALRCFKPIFVPRRRPKPSKRDAVMATHVHDIEAVDCVRV